MKTKLIRTSTIAASLNILLKGQLTFLNKNFDVVAVSGADSHLHEVLEREGVRIGDVAMNRTIAPISDIISLVKLYQLFKKEKPFIVHSITPKAGLLSMVAGKCAGVPIRMHTFTGLIFPTKTGFLKRILILMDKILCWHATHIYPEGNGVRNDLLAFNITKKPLQVLANGNVNGIDTGYFNKLDVQEKDSLALRKELGVGETNFVFIFVGRLVRDKGINELVEAFELIFAKHSGVKLLLVGPFETELDPLEPKTMDCIHQNSAIISVGFQENVRLYFSIANCLVFPSYREGFPNVVLQAGAMGLPSIVTDINGSNEIILDLENGLIGPVKNSRFLFEAMQTLIEDVELYDKLKLNARAMIVSRFEQELVWNSLLNEYKRIIHHV